MKYILPFQILTITLIAFLVGILFLGKDLPTSIVFAGNAGLTVFLGSLVLDRFSKKK